MRAFATARCVLGGHELCDIYGYSKRR
jgi:hypothetical protein